MKMDWRNLTCRWGLLLLVGSLVPLLVLAACSPSAPSIPTPRATLIAPLPTADPGALLPVVRGAISPTISTRGRVVSAREATLSFPVDGVVMTLTAQLGAQVKKGDVLAELDAWALESQVFDAQRQVEGTQVKLDQARIAQARKLAQAEADFKVAQAQAAVSAGERDYQLWQIQQGKVKHGSEEEQALKKLSLQADLDQANLARAQAQLEAARVSTEIPLLAEDLRQARLELERLQARLQVARLHAPFDGTIVSLDVRQGDSLKAYQKIGMVADPSQPMLTASVFEDDIAGIQAGQPVSIKLDGSPNRSFSGKVAQVGAQPTLSQGRNVYEVIILFDDPAQAPAAARQGADVAISLLPRQDALLIPSQTIMREGSQAFVQVSRDGQTIRVPVRLGSTDGSRTEVVSGLKEGDTVRVP